MDFAELEREVLRSAHINRLKTAILTDGKSKQDWREARGRQLTIYHYGEAPPLDLAAIADICVLRTAPNGNFRLRCLIANLAVAGGILIALGGYDAAGIGLPLFGLLAAVLVVWQPARGTRSATAS